MPLRPPPGALGPRSTFGPRLGTGLLGLACWAACASPPPRPASLLEKQDPAWRNGVRQAPLTAEEVEQSVRRKLGEIEECYVRERLNTSTPAGFVFELDIPADGSEHRVSTIESNPAGQVVLEECIKAVFQSMEFPPHTGGELLIKVPVRPGGGG